jgi:hypothetical protein
LVSRHLDEIARIKVQTPVIIRRTLQQLPSGLKETFETCFQRIQNQANEDLSLAQRIFRWLLCCKRPLRLKEVIQGVCLDPDQTHLHDQFLPTETSSILSVCSNLISVKKDGRDEIVEFYHSYVREFILASEKDQHSSANTVVGPCTNAETEIARTCLSYLSLDEFDVNCLDVGHSGLELIDTENSNPLCDLVQVVTCEAGAKSAARILDDAFPLLHYAAHYWAEHVLQSDWEDESYSQMLQPFITSNRLFTWVSVCSVYDALETCFPSHSLTCAMSGANTIKKCLMAHGTFC